MDFRLKGLSIESKNTQNRARTRKLWPSEVGGLAQTVQLGSCVKPTKLHSRGSFKAPVHAIFPRQTHPGNNPFTRQQIRPNWYHKSAINMVQNSSRTQPKISFKATQKKLDIIAQNQKKKISFCVREHNQTGHRAQPRPKQHLNEI